MTEHLCFFCSRPYVSTDTNVHPLARSAHAAHTEGVRAPERAEATARVDRSASVERARFLLRTSHGSSGGGGKERGGGRRDETAFVGIGL
jgi:hypothetical protein